LIFSSLIAFIQGFDQIIKASETHKWDINLAEVSRIWQGGCIIRSKLLESFRNHFYSGNSNPLLSSEIAGLLNSSEKSVIEFIHQAGSNRIPAPAISSTLAYFNSHSKSKTGINLIQALRDAFGAHTYERTDREGIFHSKW